MFKVEYSIHDEIHKVVTGYYRTATSFYQQKGFIVSDTLYEGNKKLIYLPYFNAFKKFKPDEVPDVKTFIKSSNEAILTEFASRKVQGVSESQFNSFKDEVMSYESEISRLLRQIFPDEIIDRLEITISPVKYGSYCSFTAHPKEEMTVEDVMKTPGAKIRIATRVRIDISPKYIIEGIVSSLTMSLMSISRFNWQNNCDKNEYLADFIIQHTKLNTFFPEYEGTGEIISGKDEIKSLIESSNVYLAKLGLTPTHEQLAINDGVTVNNKAPKIKFSKSEEKTIEYLLDNKNKVSTFENLGKHIWGKRFKEKYSMLSLAKIVQRTREKLKANGLSAELIQTVRGQGYIYLG